MNPARKPTARKPATAKAKKATAKKSASKATAKKTGAKKTSARAPKKVAAKKAGAKKTPVKKTVKKTMTKKGSGRKPARSRLRARKPIVPPTPKRPVRPMKLDKEILASIRKQLADESDDLNGQLEEMERESFEGTQSEITGEVGLDEDFADAGSATFERESALSIQNNIRDLIDQIQRAINRIDEGAYGRCERCGQPIDAARLRALPHASLCMDCKRREERLR